MTQKQNELIAALEAIEGKLETCSPGQPAAAFDIIDETLQLTRDALADVAEDIQPSLTMKHCLRCGHDWYPKGPERPKVCPRPRGCGSLSWDKEWDERENYTYS